MKTNSTTRLIVSLCTALLLSIGLTSFTIYNSDGPEVPPEFNKNKEEVLLCVLEGRKSYDKYMIKNVDKYYLGKHEFVLRSDLDKDKYKDKTKYRFVFDFGNSKVYQDKKGKWWEITGADYYFVFDRKKEKKYYSDIRSDAFSKMIARYSKALEVKRLSY